MEDVFLLTLVTVNQDGEVLIALVVSKDLQSCGEDICCYERKIP